MKALLLAVALLGALGAQVEDQKNRPVTKVVNLLRDMQKNLQKEAEEDESVYNKLACWCKTNDKEKTQAIKDAESKITDLQSRIEEYTATSSRLNTEIKNLNNEIAKNQDALAKATEIRKKELAEFNAEEKDSLQSISAMKSAITVLSKHHRGDALVDIAHVVSHINFKHSDLLSEPEKKVLDAFIQAPQEFFDSKPIFKQSYAPQSGEIFGILRNMLETFEGNLSQSQKDEMAAQAAFTDLKEAKQAEIKEGQHHVAKKKQELANTDENNAISKEDLEDTRNSLSADQEFLMNLKEKCQMTDQEWEQRQKTRAEETQAISEAISVLSNDDAHDTFSRTFNPSLLQKASATVINKRRTAAARVLAQAAQKLNKPQLSALATQVRLDAFTRVKAAIDEMITKLIKEKEDEIKHKDFCVSELNANDKENQKTDMNRQTLESEIDTLKAQISTLKQEIEDLTAQVAEHNVQLKRAGEDRELENKDFQTTVADQRATQQLLNKALTVLQGFYNKKNPNTGLVQEPAGPPPPPGFKTYKKQGGAGGVLGLLAQIISDAKVMEAEAVQAETDSQAAYESFVKDTNATIEQKQNQIMNKRDTKATKEKELSNKEQDHANTMTTLEQLANAATDLHKACDFVTKNFDMRQTARDQEVEALRQAKSILSGAKFDFLQKRA